MEEDAQVEECRYCKHELSVCHEEEAPACNLQIPITNQYCFEMFIPCGLRDVIEEYVHRIEPDAIPGEMKMWTPYFVTREGLQYEAIIEFGDAGSKITGGGWKQLMNDYAVRPGHIMYMYLRNGGHRISVDFKADGVQLSPLFFVAMRGLSRTKAKLIDRCIYARGIRLQYHKMKILIESSFGPTKYPCCVFVNRMSNRDVTGGYMRVPKRVIARIEKKSGLLDREGEVLLVIDADTHVDAKYKKIPDERLVLHAGFKTYASLLGLKGDDVVAICFQKLADTNAMKVWISVIA
uniref:Uncharacterized protein n=1 Tax=Hordeum vulgare subsp. vulgare TaxID=112509 RepID=A0A8I6X4R1_HORVV